MSFIQFESATDKDKAREELRDARNELLRRAEQKVKWRQEKVIQAELRGDNKWISPNVLKKIDKMAKETEISKSKKVKKKHKKEKHSKKDKEKKKKKSHDSSDSSSEEEIIVKKKKKKAKYSTSESDSDSDSESDKWVEKKLEVPKARDDWMGGVLFATYTKEKVNPKEDKKTIDNKYNPGECSRELNPYWKNGGNGLPTFHKPKDDSDDDNGRNQRQNYSKSFFQPRGNWRKKDLTRDSRRKSRSRSKEREQSFRRKSRSKSPVSSSSSSSSDDEKNVSKTNSSLPQMKKQKEELNHNDFLTDQQMNDLGAKMIKAEIMGNDTLAADLKLKLDAARNYRKNHKEFLKNKQRPIEKPQKSNQEDEEHIILTKTDNTGNSRPLGRQQQPEDPWGGRRARKSKKVDTHTNNERTRYYPDDDRFTLKDMFEREKLVTSNDQNEEFLNLLIKNKVSSRNDIEDIFTTDDKSANKSVNVNSAISQYNKITKELENCDKCFNSSKMEKQLIVTLGNKCYLSVPSYEDLQLGHCLIVPINHASCSTELDEDVWDEINEFRKALINMFAKRRQECIFFENANYIKKRKHMTIHCIPVENYEILQFYFKKAIEETETEWSHNKKLIKLNKKNIKRAVPKGLPYFWVNFGMENGFAHVIEDQDKFSNYFAEEIIGGFLNLEPRLWRKPRRKNNPIVNVKQFSEWWKPYDFTAT